MSTEQRYNANHIFNDVIHVVESSLASSTHATIAYEKGVNERSTILKNFSPWAAGATEIQINLKNLK